METKTLLRCALSVAALAATIAARPTHLVALRPLLSGQFHARDALGQYSYGYADAHSSKIEVRTLDGVTRGGYSYVDADGRLQSVHYVSDARGFRVDATNSPKDAAAAPGDRKESKTVAETVEKVAPVPPAAIPIPAGVSLRPTLLAPLPLHTIAPLATVKLTPGVTYSYEYTLPASAALTYASPFDGGVVVGGGERAEEAVGGGGAMKKNGEEEEEEEERKTA